MLKIQQFNEESKVKEGEDQLNLESMNSQTKVYTPSAKINTQSDPKPIKNQVKSRPRSFSPSRSLNLLKGNSLLNRSLLNRSASNNLIQSNRSLEGFYTTSPNFQMNTLSFDIRLYKNYQGLMKEGHHKAAKCVSQLMTNSIPDIKKAIVSSLIAYLSISYIVQ